MRSLNKFTMLALQPSLRKSLPSANGMWWTYSSLALSGWCSGSLFDLLLSISSMRLSRYVVAGCNCKTPEGQDELIFYKLFSIFLKGPWYSSQTWTYVVQIDKTFSLRSVWGQLMLPFISYGMNNEADRGSFLWEFSTRGPQKILSMGFYCSEDPLWDPF